MSTPSTALTLRVFVAGLVVLFAALAAALPGVCADAPAAITSELLQQWGRAEYLFTARLDAVVAGPMGLSNPPMYTHRLTFLVDEVLRGSLQKGQRIVASHVIRQQKRPTFPQDKLCVVTANLSRERFQALTVAAANEKLLARIRLVAAVPLGWTADQAGLVCPWASMPSAWPAEAKGQGPLVCAKTGRPALLMGKEAVLKVEPVPPVEAIKWTNPDGDGEYKITVSNPTDHPIQVPALLSAGGEILWKESLLIICQDKVYPIPGCRGVTSLPQPTTLAPGQSVSTVVNALALRGPEWPRGGYRIEFQFCLGEQSSTQSFYYMSRHHDKLRDRAQQAAGAE